ncbi:Pentapeptide repeat family protein [Geitlerinema sp. FC II]|nr:pentapeptide repeat-containing protein [Geitlerinema sp. CS-897]PPT09238.1 Pentapeptide repeat family protein [Geitlerinema sp. FC II]
MNPIFRRSVVLATLVSINFIVPDKTKSENLLLSQNPSGQPSSIQPTPDPEVVNLEKEKLKQEIEKIEAEKRKIENDDRNNSRDLTTTRGWINLLFGNGSVIIAIILGFSGFVRYLQELREERKNKEDERFESIVKSLGSEHLQERIGAAVLLPTFLRPKYERFYIQVFNLAAGNLKAFKIIYQTRENDRTDSQNNSLDPLEPILANVLRESYPQARDTLFFCPHLKARQLWTYWLSKKYFWNRILHKIKAIKISDEDCLEMVRSQLNATAVQLDESYLSNADLRYIWLRHASLQKATLSNCVLQNANLEKANLEYTVFYKADLKGANLKYANLAGANLNGANLSGAKLYKANLEYAHLYQSTLQSTDLKEANLRDTNLIGAKFIGANLHFTKLPRANLQYANLKDADLFCATLDSANLKGANFRGAKYLLPNIIKQACYWQQAKFDDDFWAELNEAPNPNPPPDCSIWKYLED